MPDGVEKESVSPYCVRCGPSHRGYTHYFHETSEHDDWWAKQNLKEK